MSAGIHRILLVSDLTLGTWLSAQLKADDREVAIVESYGRHEAIYARLASQAYDLVVLTNTTLSPMHFPVVVPEIRARFPSVCIMVLSGWMAPDFVADLERMGVRDLFPLPMDVWDVARRITEILEGHKATVQADQP